jgi:hypothetical protein
MGALAEIVELLLRAWGLFGHCKEFVFIRGHSRLKKRKRKALASRGRGGGRGGDLPGHKLF